VAKVSGISKGTFYIAMGGICVTIVSAALLVSRLFIPNKLLGIAGAVLALYGLAVAAVPVYLEALLNHFKRAHKRANHDKNSQDEEKEPGCNEDKLN
jgi:membrane-bound ClpP family serine protease